MAIPESRRLAFKEIPIIDLSSLVSGKTDHQTVEDIGTACREVGFLYIKNHGVQKRLIDDILVAGREFFSRPVAQKEEVLLDKRIRGYLPLGIDLTMENRSQRPVIRRASGWALTARLKQIIASMAQICGLRIASC